MFFSIKNKLIPTLVLFVGLAAFGIGMKCALGLEWNLGVYDGITLHIALAIAAQVTSNTVIFFAMRAVAGDWFLDRYRAFCEHFKTQKLAHMIAGGIMAGGEELVFRGVLLEWLLGVTDPPAAVAVSAVVFGLAHLIPTRQMAPFLAWAIWEGAVLGTIYVLTGSMLVLVIVHVLNDSLGFGLMAHQRRTGWMLGLKGSTAT